MFSLNRIPMTRHSTVYNGLNREITRNIPMTMEEFGDLPEFFQTSGQEITLDTIEEPTRELTHIETSNTATEIDEQVTRELINFFDGTPYDDLDVFFRSFEFGDTWRSNPIFTDEFALSCLPKRLCDMVYELHAILDIHRFSAISFNRNDLRYSSLSKAQQTQVRYFVHGNARKHQQLDDLYNRLTGFRSRTESYQVKFLLNLTIDVVQDVLRKNQQQ
jgi:hypothetical protein